MKITSTHHNAADGSLTILIKPDAPDNTEMHKAMTKLRMSVTRVAKQAGVSLAPIGFTLERPAYEDLIRNARTNDTGWNALCANVVTRIEEMQTEITTLKQMNRGLRADLDGMVAQQEEQEREQAEEIRCKPSDVAMRVEWDTRVMLPVHWHKYIAKIREFHGMSQFMWDCSTNEAKKNLALRYDNHVLITTGNRPEDRSGARAFPCPPASIGELQDRIRQYVADVQAYFSINEHHWKLLSDQAKDALTTTYDRLQEGRI